jgi:hypothetical protein
MWVLSYADRFLRSKAFLYAQCQFILSDKEMPRDYDSLPTLRTLLKTALEQGRVPPPELLALETAANQQFNDLLLRIKDIVSTAKYVPIPKELPPGGAAGRGPVMQPPSKRHKRSEC